MGKEETLGPKTGERYQNLIPALIHMAYDQGCILLPKIEFFINHYLEALSFL